MQDKSTREAVSDAAQSRLRMLTKIRTEAQHTAKQRHRAKECSRRRNLQQHIEYNRRRRIRAALACQGVAVLCGLGASPEFQSLLEASGSSLLLFGGSEETTPGYDMSDVHWRWTSFIAFTKTHLRVANYSETSGDSGMTFRRDKNDTDFDFRFPYHFSPPLGVMRPLLRIATAYTIDLEEMLAGDVTQRYAPEVLFEILIECTEPLMLKTHLKNVIG